MLILIEIELKFKFNVGDLVKIDAGRVGTIVDRTINDFYDVWNPGRTVSVIEYRVLTNEGISIKEEDNLSQTGIYLDESV
jgi:hypothetical protein